MFMQGFSGDLQEAHAKATQIVGEAVGNVRAREGGRERGRGGGGGAGRGSERGRETGREREGGREGRREREGGRETEEGRREREGYNFSLYPLAATRKEKKGKRKKVGIDGARKCLGFVFFSP